MSEKQIKHNLTVSSKFLLISLILGIFLGVSTILSTSRALGYANATYEMMIGETNILSQDDFGNGNLLLAQQVTLSEIATIQSLSFYVTNLSGRLRLGIYDDSGGNPQNLITQTAEFTPVIGWNTQVVETPTQLNPGTYWLAYLPESNDLHFRVDLTSGTARYYNYSFGSLPTTFSGSPVSVTAHWSFYATLLTETPPTPTPTPTATAVTTGIDFSPKVDLDIATGPTDVTTGDLDGDDLPDIAIANFGPVGSYGDTVSVLRNTSVNQIMSFAAKIDITVGTAPHDIIMGDLDDDNKPDLVVTQYGSYGNGSTVGILQNLSSVGLISFGSLQSFGVGSGPIGVAIGDLNGDTKPDLAVTNYYEGNGTTISVLVNTSSGGVISFAAKQDYSVGTGPYGIGVADLDDDGKLDIVVSNKGTFPGNGNTISVLRNITVGGILEFAPKVDFTTGFGPRELAIVDMDGDGKHDVVVGEFGNNYNGTIVSVFRNTSTIGTISFAPKVNLTVGLGPLGLTVGDLDGDGKSDIAVTNYGDNTGDGTTLSVLENLSTTGSLAFATHKEFTTGAGPHAVAIDDLNGDTKPDLTVVNYGNGYEITTSLLQNTTDSPTAVILHSFTAHQVSSNFLFTLIISITLMTTLVGVGIQLRKKVVTTRL